MPPDPLRARLSEIIAEFARRRGMPPFEPHVTVLGDIAGTLERIRESTRKIGKLVRPFEVRFEGTGSDDAFFRAAYLRVGRSEGLLEARTAAERLLGERAADEGSFHPHLSLAYGSPDESAKEELFGKARRLGLDHESFVATRITLAESSSELPIERWRVLDHRRLTRGPAAPPR